MRYYILTELKKKGFKTAGQVVSTKHEIEWFDEYDSFKERCEELDIEIDQEFLESVNEALKEKDISNEERIEAIEEALLELMNNG